MACNRGIYDSKPTVEFLADRIFDNVRMDLDRRTVTMSTDAVLTGATPLYCSGNGAIEPNMAVIPHYSENKADVSGIVAIPLTLTYNYNSATLNAPCTVNLPFSAVMNIPDSSIWPIHFSIHYSLFCDNISQAEGNGYTALADGVTVSYITSTVPVTAYGFGQIEYNAIASREISAPKAFQTTDFYPVKNN